MGTDDPDSSQRGTARLAGLFSSTWLHAAAANAIDLVFPPRCAGCGRVGFSWCERCVLDTQAQAPLLQHSHFLALTAVAATGSHTGKLREAVQALKYDNVRALARFMAVRMAYALQHLDWEYDVILPVPMGSARLRERRYNQAGLIAAALAREVNVAVQPSLLWRIRETRSQVGLSADERLLNVAKAFAAHPTLLTNQSILLIDDVYTTGATLNACAEALRVVGVREVYALTVTAAQHQ
jgi:ComF family protein